MTNYKLIADGDPGGNIDTAFASMKAETVTTSPEVRLTYLAVARSVGAGAASKLNARVLATQSPWVDHALNNEGVDINNPQIPALLNSMVNATFTQANADAVKAIGNVTQSKYPRLRQGHLEDARRLRAEGKI